MKKIAFCCDGTWSHPKSKDSVTTTDTNVYKLYKALLTTATQVARYDDGVGADTSLVEHFLGGAFGEGLFAKIREGYTKIAHDYLDGDAIYLFGFSRGAYTARSISGMLTACGLPAKLTDDAINDAFHTYRMTPGSPERAAAKASLAAKYGNRPVLIQMIGVWDTVGSLGVPSLIGGVDPLRYGFLDTKLSAQVKSAYHAMAIDERRLAFPPTLWDGDPAPGQVVEQVWFTGCHSSVGGGCPDAGLSDITLKWMLSKCRDQGLEIDPAIWAKYEVLDTTVHALDVIDESWSPFWGLPRIRSVPSDSTIASTVGARLQHLKDYSPANLILTAERMLAKTYRAMTI